MDTLRITGPYKGASRVAFDFSKVSLSKRLYKQSIGWWEEAPRARAPCHCGVYPISTGYLASNHQKQLRR